jgi:hypothetical protein
MKEGVFGPDQANIALAPAFRRGERLNSPLRKEFYVIGLNVLNIRCLTVEGIQLQVFP